MGRRQSGLPTSLQEAFKVLDEMLTSEDLTLFRSQTREEFVITQHFGLGQWVRNTWFFGSDEETRRRLFGDDYLHADAASGELLEKYYNHLISTKNETTRVQDNPKEIR